jgi:hypothetical protein
MKPVWGFQKAVTDMQRWSIWLCAWLLLTAIGLRPIAGLAAAALELPLASNLNTFPEALSANVVV